MPADLLDLLVRNANLTPYPVENVRDNIGVQPIPDSLTTYKPSEHRPVTDPPVVCQCCRYRIVSRDR